MSHLCGGNGETALSPDEQKAFLESVGKEIIALGDVDNWKNIVSSIHAFVKTIEGTEAP